MKNIFQSVFILCCLFTSTNRLHAQWKQANETDAAYVYCFAAAGTHLFAGTDYRRIFCSADNGTNWSVVNGLPNYRYDSTWYPSINALAVSDSSLFAGTEYGVFLSKNNGASWSAINGESTINYVHTIAVSGSNLFVGTFAGGVLLSTNNGTSWSAVNTGLANPYINSFAISGTNLFAGTSGGGIFLSTDDGTSWSTINAGLTNPYVYAIAVSGTKIFIGTWSGVFLSTNNGTAWTAVNAGLTDPVNALTVSGTNLFAGTWRGVFLSTNNGTDWTAVNDGLTNSVVNALAVSGTNLFAGTNGSGVWKRPVQETMPVVRISGISLAHFDLDQNYPNPFNPTTRIHFSLPTPCYTTLKIYDPLGRQSHTLLSGTMDAGDHSTVWDASKYPSGVYFYLLQSGSMSATRKLLLLK